MPEDDGQGHRQVALHDMKVTVANARGSHPHPDLTFARVEDLDVLDRERLGALVEDGGRGVHGVS
jgi:hypothetical protein